jgi:hypothetical protein
MLCPLLVQDSVVMAQLFQAHAYCSQYVQGALQLEPQLLSKARAAWAALMRDLTVSQLQRDVYHVFAPFVRVRRTCRHRGAQGPGGNGYSSARGTAAAGERHASLRSGLLVLGGPPWCQAWGVQLPVAMPIAIQPTGLYRAIGTALQGPLPQLGQPHGPPASLHATPDHAAQ